MRSKVISRERGQDLIEYALILPLFLLLVVMIIDLARATITYTTLYNAVREGARYGIIHPEDSANIINAVKHYSPGLNSADIVVVPNYNTTNETIQVKATYDFLPMTPFANFLGFSPLTLSSQSTMYVEQ